MGTIRKTEDGQAEPEQASAMLTLSSVGDPQDLKLRLELRNTGTTQFSVDRELVWFFSVSCLDDAGDYFSFRPVGFMPSPKPGEATLRFVSLRPGETIAGVLDLREGFVGYRSGFVTRADWVGVTFAEEPVFRVGVGEHPARVRVGYSTREDPRGAFEAYTHWEVPPDLLREDLSAEIELAGPHTKAPPLRSE